MVLPLRFVSIGILGESGHLGLLNEHPLLAGTLAQNHTNPTFIIWKTVQVNLNREVVSGFRRNDIGAIFSLQDLLGAILQELIVTFDLNGHQDLRFGFRSRNMERNTVEV
jgi:hypothetical protein